MKAFAITFILVVTLALLLFIRGGETWDIRHSIPFLGGHPIQVYDFAAAALLFMAIIGFASIYFNAEDDSVTYHATSADWRPRWSILIILGVILSCMWLTQALQPAFSWPQFLDAIKVKNHDRYSQLASLGVIATSTLMIARISLGRKDH